MLGTFTYASMTAAFVAETERWDAAKHLLGSPQAKLEDAKSQAGAVPILLMSWSPRFQLSSHVVWQQPRKACAMLKKYRAELATIREEQSGSKEPFIAQVVKMTEIQELEIAALINVAKSDFDDAIKTMKHATELEEAMPPPSGPPTVIKPPHELFGEILLRAGHPKEAAQQFGTSLLRHPDGPVRYWARHAPLPKTEILEAGARLCSILASMAAGRCEVTRARRGAELLEAGRCALA